MNVKIALTKTQRLNLDDFQRSAENTAGRTIAPVQLGQTFAVYRVEDLAPLAAGVAAYYQDCIDYTDASGAAESEAQEVAMMAFMVRSWERAADAMCGKLQHALEGCAFEPSELDAALVMLTGYESLGDLRDHVSRGGVPTLRASDNENRGMMLRLQVTLDQLGVPFAAR